VVDGGLGHRTPCSVPPAPHVVPRGVGLLQDNVEQQAT
jgi:hypothetical protein